ncbi:MAG TPA: hypothetical protein VMR23_16800 [Candidatus Limnocylindria bacterium]|nr:hypothetical protein [Candidatus Limnocylindria bacterium]
MRIVCAWCQREGRTGFLGFREPLSDMSVTHGICPEHYEDVLAALRAPSLRGVEMLIVVNRGEDGLYRYLEEAFAGIRGVMIVVERRRRERRQALHPVAQERRQAQRRARRGRLSAMGYRVLRFAR